MNSRHTFGSARRNTLMLFAGVGLLVSGAVLFAGPLDPPAGPVAGTGKALNEVEPRIAINSTNTPGDSDSLYKISQPGSYYLTSNITGVAGKHGIEIAASGVVLDLNGFALVGVAGMGAFDGITVSVFQLTDIRVTNGTVQNWGGDGVDLIINETFSSSVTDVSATGNIGSGIIAGNNSIVNRCACRSNGADGIAVGSGTTVSNCTSRNSGGNGIRGGFGQNIFADCIVSFNARDGISVGSESIVRSNVCARNGLGAADGAGIHVLAGDNRIEGYNCVGADRGVDIDAAGNVIIRNSCSGNTTDWDIAANNIFGQIVDRRAPASSAVLRFSAASSLGSADSNANFSY